MDFSIVIEEILETARDWPEGTVIAVLWLALLAILVFFSLILVNIAVQSLYGFVNTVGLKRKQTRVIITHKEYTPSRITTIMIFNSATNTSTPQPMLMPAEWEVVVNLNGEDHYVGVEQDFYKEVSIGDDILVTYAIGRFSGRSYIKDVGK